MMKFTLILATVLLCSPKLSINSFKEQLEYPGMKNGTTHVNYQIEIANPKEKTIEIEKVWAKGKFLRFTQQEYSSNPIKLYVSDVWQNPEVETTKSPTGHEKDLGVIQFHVKGKSKTRFVGISMVDKLEPLARP